MTNNTTLEISGGDVGLTLALMFGFLLIAMGFKDKMWWLLAGPVWIIEGLTVFFEIDSLYMVVAVGLGMVLLIRGALDAIR